MSWYLANQNGIIDQFATISGLADLRAASQGQPALKDFFEVGATKNTTLCEYALYRVAKKTKDDSVKSTAKGLAAMLRGEITVWITDGTTGHPNSAKVKEAAAPPRSLRHPDHAKLIDPIKKRMARLFAGYFRRQEKAVLDDVRLRFYVGKEYKESLRRAGALQLREDDDDGTKRAAELLPDNLSPLTFATTPKEDQQYMEMIRLAIERAEKQLADELETDARIPDSSMTAYLRENGLSKLTGELSETSKQRLRDAIADSINAGGTADDIVAAIKVEFEEFSDYRANMIAQTECNRSFNWARNELADQAGMTHKMWVVESVSPCLICVANMAEGWIEFDGEFLSSDNFAPAHPNCQCGVDFQLRSSGEGK